MADVLSEAEVEKILEEERVGRLACSADGEAYVVPMVYAYDGGSVYCHSLEGKKVRIMRANPRVCFQVDRPHATRDWESVIARGTYEELSGEEAERAMLALIARFRPATPSAAEDSAQNAAPGIVFRITLAEKTGRAGKP
ncbi:MAG: pyridoxamine 5'-phosphate oxidase family protein [Candidatus Baltobacteraceae bacterium]